MKQDLVPFFCIPNSLYDSAPVASAESGVAYDRVVSGVSALCKRLYEAKALDVAVASKLLGGDAVLKSLVGLGVLLEHGNNVTTLLTQKHAELRESRREAARSRWDALSGRPAKKKKQRREEKGEEKRGEEKRNVALQTDAHAMQTDALASAPADVLPLGLDPHQENRPQLALAAPDIPERSAFREAQEVLCEEFASLRAGSYKWQGARDGAALKGLLEAGASVAELRERWVRALTLEKWPACSTVAELANKWNHLARIEIKHKVGNSNVF